MIPKELKGHYINSLKKKNFDQDKHCALSLLLTVAGDLKMATLLTSEFFASQYCIDLIDSFEKNKNFDDVFQFVIKK